MRTLLGSFCQSLDCEIVEAADGREALEQMALHQPFDFALVDWDMPVMNGLELVKVLRANPAYNDMKLMMVTAQTSMDSVVEAIENGANDYLMKPLTEEMFQDKLKLLGIAG